MKFPTHGDIVLARPKSRFWQVAHRIARRFSPKVADAFFGAVERTWSQIDDRALVQALAGGKLALIEKAAGTGRLAAILADSSDLEDALMDASTATGRAGAQILSGVSGVDLSFTRANPNVVIYARRQIADLVVAVSDDAREAIRIVVALGASEGLTIEQQARAIRQVVGLPPNWAEAPLNLRRDILAGDIARATGRRLSATDKAQIRSRIMRGTVTEEFAAEMQERYTRSLVNRRALNIARTESLRAAHAGQRIGWADAVRQGALPPDARRVWIVTPDDRLRPEHAAIPGMNPEGVGLNEPFETPLGRFLDPPIAPNCRCGVGLLIPGRPGTL